MSTNASDRQTLLANHLRQQNQAELSATVRGVWRNRGWSLERVETTWFRATRENEVQHLHVIADDVQDDIRDAIESVDGPITLVVTGSLPHDDRSWVIRQDRVSLIEADDLARISIAEDVDAVTSIASDGGPSSGASGKEDDVELPAALERAPMAVPATIAAYAPGFLTSESFALTVPYVIEAVFVFGLVGGLSQALTHVLFGDVSWLDRTLVYGTVLGVVGWAVGRYALGITAWRGVLALGVGLTVLGILIGPQFWVGSFAKRFSATS